jgi:hypothetical protein
MTDTNGQGDREIPVDQAEIDAIDAQAQRAQASAQFDLKGRLLRTVVTTKDYLAGAEPFDLIQGLDKGGVVNLGTLAGEIYSVEKKTTEWQGKELTSYWLNGTFQAVVASTGEVFTGGQAILPKAYGVQVYNAFKDAGVTMVTLGCSIGLRLASRTIPYEWVVRDHMLHASTARVAAISDNLGQLLGLTPPTPVKRIA